MINTNKELSTQEFLTHTLSSIFIYLRIYYSRIIEITE